MKQHFIYVALWQISEKHQRNGVNPTLKQKCWSAERKHNTPQRTSWGEVSQAVWDMTSEDEKCTTAIFNS